MMHGVSSIKFYRLQYQWHQADHFSLSIYWLSMHSCKLQSVEDFQHGSTATNSINSVLFVSCGRSLSRDCLCRFDMDLDFHSTLSSTLVWWTFNCDYLLDFDFYLLLLTGAPFAPFMTRSSLSGQRFDTLCYNLAAPVVTNTTMWYEEVVLSQFCSSANEYQ
jgi:hypothetical protein